MREYRSVSRFCYGCLTYDGTEDCSLYNNVGNCPCINCILKMICQDSCQKYCDWITPKRKKTGKIQIEMEDV